MKCAEPDRCEVPKDLRPGVTTYFCVYNKGHEGSHSWEDPPAIRAEKLLRQPAEEGTR